MLRSTSRFAVVLVSMLLWAATATAQSGKKDFQLYCAACHGRNGKGNGTWWNGIEVPDLTHLSQANGGKFPSEEVYEVIDGRSRSQWHQRRRGMPYWPSLG
jgi:mono/diheme cytochrome c family protein